MAGGSRRKKARDNVWLHNICMPGILKKKKKGSEMLLEEIILCYNSRCRESLHCE